MNKQNTKKYPVDILIEKLNEISKKNGKPPLEGVVKTGSFIHISPKLKTMKTDNMKKQLNQEAISFKPLSASSKEKAMKMVKQMKERQMRARAYEMEYMKKLTQEVNGNISPIDLFDTEGELP